MRPTVVIPIHPCQDRSFEKAFVVVAVEVDPICSSVSRGENRHF